MYNYNRGSTRLLGSTQGFQAEGCSVNLSYEHLLKYADVTMNLKRESTVSLLRVNEIFNSHGTILNEISHSYS